MIERRIDLIKGNVIMIRKIAFISLMLVTAFLIQASEITITQPGLYTLGDNLASLPTGPDSIINITVSDVVLNLNDHVVSQANLTASVNGILINNNLSNITIKNGIIRNVTGTGILVNQLARRIVIDSITFEGCGFGLSLAGAVGNPVSDTQITNCNFFACNSGGNAVVNMSQCTRIGLNNCIIASTGSSVPTVCVQLSSVTVSTIKNILIQGNATTATLFGLVESGGSQNTFSNIVLRNNSASGPAAFFGIRVLGSTSDMLSNCLVTLNVSNAATMVAYEVNGSQTCVLDNCRASVNTGSTSCIGFNLIGTSNQLSVIDCIANGNVANAGPATGFLIDNANFGTFLRTMAINNVSVTTNCVGISLQGAGGTSDAFVDSFCARNFGVAAANSFGINRAAGVTDMFTRSICFNNGVNTANQVVGIVAGSVVNLASPGSSNMNTTTLPWTNLGVNA